MSNTFFNILSSTYLCNFLQLLVMVYIVHDDRLV